ncbi:MAG: type II secretion system F family protein [Clostridium sp.]|jgi:tight adherence protein B|nr:type II secretion system F family protein [Clostridium sp.]
MWRSSKQPDWESKKDDPNQKDCHSKKDYQSGLWKPQEAAVEIARGLLLTAGLAHFFYRSVPAFFPLCLVGALYLKKRKEEKLSRCRAELVLQFKECVLSVAASLQAGYAVENAFSESLSDMRLLFGSKADICRELETIRRGLIWNLTMEELLWDFGKRSHTKEIQEFAEVFSIAKHSGGNISEMIRHFAKSIGQKIQAEEEIRVLLSARKLEKNVMSLMPFGIFIYVGFGNPGYFDNLYHNFTGITIMTVCLFLYLTAYCLAERILRKAGEIV